MSFCCDDITVTSCFMFSLLGAVILESRSTPDSGGWQLTVSHGVPLGEIKPLKKSLDEGRLCLIKPP